MAVVGSALSAGSASQKSAKDAAVLLMVAARALHLAKGNYENEVLLAESLALTKLPSYEPCPKEDLLCFAKVLSSVPPQVLEAEVQNPEGQKCSVLAWLRHTVKALVQDEKVRPTFEFGLQAFKLFS